MVISLMASIVVSCGPGPFSELDPSTYAPVYIGTLWPSVTHYVEANKFRDGEIRFKIQMAESIDQVVQIVMSHENHIREDWHAVRDSVMRNALLARAKQSEAFRAALARTSDARIEYKCSDSYWGLGSDDRGENRVGMLLVEMRQSLSSLEHELATPMLPPWKAHANLDSQSIGWRMGVGESYLVEWSTWFSGLSQTQRERYMGEYPEPNDWKGFYSR